MASPSAPTLRARRAKPERSLRAASQRTLGETEGVPAQAPAPASRAQQGTRANLEDLADQLGVSPSDLLEQLDSGANLRSLISAGYGSSARARGGLVVDRYA